MLPESAIGEAVTALGAVIVAGFTLIGIILGRTSSHAKAAARDSAIARNEVKNSHTTNLREEQDERHGVLIKLFSEVSHTMQSMTEKQDSMSRHIDTMASDQKGVKRDIGRVADIAASLSERHDVLVERQIDTIERLHKIETLNASQRGQK